MRVDALAYWQEVIECEVQYGFTYFKVPCCPDGAESYYVYSECDILQ